MCLLGPVRQKEGRETGQVLFFHNCQWGSPDFNKGTTPPPPSPHLRPCCALWPEPHRQPRRLRSTPGPEPHVASSECWHAWTRTPYCKVRMLWARLGPNTWHIFWQSIWHSFWHSVWHMFWHSICNLSGILSHTCSGPVVLVHQVECQNICQVKCQVECQHRCQR